MCPRYARCAASLCILLVVRLAQTNSLLCRQPFAVELLNRLCSVIKDYCGVLNEEAIRKNFILIIELLGEIIVTS